MSQLPALPTVILLLVTVVLVSTIITTQQHNSQHQDPQHSSIDINTFPHTHPWSRQVCLKLGSVASCYSTKQEESEDSRYE
jgi:hypothetical protein